jgi:hypothetical protein
MAGFKVITEVSGEPRFVFPIYHPSEAARTDILGAVKLGTVRTPARGLIETLLWM